MRCRVVYGRTTEYFVEGVPVSKEEFDAAVPSKADEMIADHAPPMTGSLTGWPLISLGAGVDPSQITEAEAENKKHNDPTKYVKSGERAGDAIFTSRQNRKEHLKRIGLRDNEGGFGD